MHATLLNAPGDDRLVLASGDSAAPGAARDAAAARAWLRAQARRRHWAGFQRPWAVFRLDAPDFVAQQWVAHLASAAPTADADPPPLLTAPAPRAPWRSASPGHAADGPPLPPALQREASLRYDQALAWARFSYQQLRLLGVDPAQAAQVLPPALWAPWTAAGSLYAWGRVCQACAAPTTPAELHGLTTQVARTLGAHFPLAWPVLCAALAPAGP